MAEVRTVYVKWTLTVHPLGYLIALTTNSHRQTDEPGSAEVLVASDNIFRVKSLPAAFHDGCKRVATIEYWHNWGRKKPEWCSCDEELEIPATQTRLRLRLVQFGPTLIHWMDRAKQLVADAAPHAGSLPGDQEGRLLAWVRVQLELLIAERVGCINDGRCSSLFKRLNPERLDEFLTGFAQVPAVAHPPDLVGSSTISPSAISAVQTASSFAGSTSSSALTAQDGTIIPLSATSIMPSPSSSSATIPFASSLPVNAMEPGRGNESTLNRPRAIRRAKSRPIANIPYGIPTRSSNRLKPEGWRIDVPASLDSAQMGKHNVWC